jgi:hypothetical protein
VFFSTKKALLDYYLCQDKRLNAARFFGILQQLPMELQMILCHMVVDSPNQNILTKNSEPAFRCLAQKIFEEEKEKKIKITTTKKIILSSFFSFMIFELVVVVVAIHKSLRGL